MLINLQRVAVRRRNRSAAPVSPAPVAPTLVSVDFSGDGGGSIVLHFDRAIAVSSFNGGAITVISIDDDATYHAKNMPTVSGSQMSVPLQQIGGSSGSVSVLNATGATGIASASGGAAWAGVTNFEFDE